MFQNKNNLDKLFGKRNASTSFSSILLLTKHQKRNCSTGNYSKSFPLLPNKLANNEYRTDKMKRTNITSILLT